VSQPCRLAKGGHIDRSRPMAFTFDGQRMTGFAGDTLASALLANGVTLVGRSFKYHRPRGIFCAGPEEPNALVTLREGSARTPNIPATTVELSEGLVAESQNRWPSLRFDLQAVNSLFAPLLAAGFYYKTFMGPTRRSWMLYEPFIRRAAGLGRASEAPDPDRYEVRHEFADVTVVGAGPAGLAAAIAAAGAGAQVILIEQDFLAGGSLLATADPAEAAQRAAMTERIRRLENLKVLLRTTAFGLYDGGTLGLVESCDHEHGQVRQVLVMLRARSIVFATGAIERPLVFPENDRPGVMLASAARAYLNRFGVLCGRRIVVATNNDSAYRAAIDLAEAGADVTIVDSRGKLAPTVVRMADAHGVPVRTSTTVLKVLGRHRVKAVVLAASGGPEERVAADLVCVSGGWSPTVHLTSHQGIRPRHREDIAGFVPGALGPCRFTAGAVGGTYDLEGAIAEGTGAGKLAASFDGGKPSAPPVAGPLADSLAAVSSAAPQRKSGKAFVDLQNDVTLDDVRLARSEGYESAEHLKRYTTLGMGTDQGKTSNVNALSLMAGLADAPVAQIGTTTFRPPYTPVAIGALAGRAVGRHFRPIRRTPMHAWHLENGAEMIEAGLWKRPWFYRSAGATVAEAYIAEMRFVREAAGICDISTLGKIDLQGPDAVEFLNRIYVNAWSKLDIGRARYGVMLRDDGIVLDDGTAARLGEHHFFMTTSTAKAADVMSWIEFLLQTAWTDLRVQATSVTDDWAAMSIAGPNSRAILAAALPEFDPSSDALPHTGVLCGERAGRPLRIARLSYSGELAYEVYVAASAGAATWRHILDVGKSFGLRPYGVEALGALRVEKGHVAGPEIDGRTTLDDLGLGRMAKQTRPFVGSVLRQRPALLETQRPRLVGLECLEPERRLRSGAVLFDRGEPAAGHGRGRITSVTWSPTLGKYIALGLYGGEGDTDGREVVAVHPIRSESVRARIVAPVFLDPEGKRLHG
jgi:heterotetrameric sarcosine oxidase alpha subunit